MPNAATLVEVREIAMERLPSDLDFLEKTAHGRASSRRSVMATLKICCQQSNTFSKRLNRRRPRIKKPVGSLGRLTTGFIRRFDLSAAKWSRWEKRESLSVLLHEPLNDFGEP